MFSEGREDVNDKEHAGRPSTSTTDEKINEVEKMILANRRNTVREVSKIFSLRAIKNPSAKCLHEFMDVCNEAIRNLETLELKRNQLVDVILVHFLQQKLSENLRTYPVAITADIEKMYRQIRIHPEDADYQRILWRPSPEEPVVDYRLLTIGIVRCSPPVSALQI
ncbi:hypothetical protein LAZ67_20000524 [Cordylochernes scorpioides]|uniref:Uncharacterized protein n=1 Tax=Cordylochernes scorpioides TaxID=51811 RepID=A0ABY6LM40_9ARAC|nr:hypothetical protein LAZ67_20000524 [Cordylochernes scorpioides]